MLITCSLCEEEFVDDLKFTDHFLLVHTHNIDTPQSEDDHSKLPTSEKDLENTKYSKIFNNACVICGDIKSAPGKLASHILTHLGAMPYFCSPCGFSCISKLRLQQHIFNHGTQKCSNQRYWLFTKSNMHECEACDRCFAKWTDLVFHYANRHIMEMPYKCQECRLYFNDMKDFTIHTHLHKRNTVCEICDIFFDSRPRLLDHVLEHNKLKMFRKFRHIAWNDGLSSVRNPFSVLRADYFGNSYKRVFWFPNSEDTEFLIEESSVTDPSRSLQNDEVVYGDREDVGHLCEVVFKELSEADSSIADFNKTYNRNVKSFPNFRYQDVDKSEKNSTSFGLENGNQSKADSVKEDLKNISEKQNLVPRILGKKSSINSDIGEGGCFTAVSTQLATSPTIKVPKEVDQRDCTSELQIIKKLSVVLVKLPSYVCDMKSYRKHSRQQRMMRLRTRHAHKRNTRFSNVRDSETNLRDGDKRMNETSNIVPQRMLRSCKTSDSKKNVINMSGNEKTIKRMDVQVSNEKSHGSLESRRILRSGKIVTVMGKYSPFNSNDMSQTDIASKLDMLTGESSKGTESRFGTRQVTNAILSQLDKSPVHKRMFNSKHVEDSKKDDSGFDDRYAIPEPNKFPVDKRESNSKQTEKATEDYTFLYNTECINSTTSELNNFHFPKSKSNSELVMQIMKDDYEFHKRWANKKITKPELKTFPLHRKASISNLDETVEDNTRLNNQHMSRNTRISELSKRVHRRKSNLKHRDNSKFDNTNKDKKFVAPKLDVLPVQSRKSDLKHMEKVVENDMHEIITSVLKRRCSSRLVKNIEKKSLHKPSNSAKDTEPNSTIVSLDNSEFSNKAPKVITDLDIINHDHNYPNRDKINHPFLNISSKNRQKNKIKLIKKKKLSSINKHCIDSHKKHQLNKNQKKCKRSTKTLVKNIYFNRKSTSRRKHLISKAKSHQVRVNLFRLPSCIYEKHLKMKPIMLSNVLPVITSVQSLATVQQTSGVQNFYSLVDHSYSDSLPLILEEHNYCKFYYHDSDSESTISSYSV